MSCPTVRRHRMAHPNRRPLLISAILVALTSIPTMIVVAAGTASLHPRDRSQLPALAQPDRAPVVVGPGSASAVRERPRRASVSVASIRSAGRIVISSGTASRPEAVAVAPAPVLPPPSTPVIEHDCPSPSATPDPDDEPRMDDRAWPGWDRNMHF